MNECLEIYKILVSTFITQKDKKKQTWLLHYFIQVITQKSCLAKLHGAETLSSAYLLVGNLLPLTSNSVVLNLAVH